MQKVYLLLRSNKQTGPYSLEELLQLNLKPFDLVWVEGRSAAWQYPFEIPALKPHVPETPRAEAPFQPISTSAMDERVSEASPSVLQPQNPIPSKTETPKRVFVSVPQTHSPSKEQINFGQGPVPEHKPYMPQHDQPAYERKEEVKPVIPSFSNTSHHEQKPLTGEVHTNYSRSLNEVEEEYSDWVYRQKAKKKSQLSAKDLVLAVLILAVIGGGYYIMSKPSVANSVLPANKMSDLTGKPNDTQTREVSGEEVSPGPEIRSGSSKSTITKQTKDIKTKNPLTVSKSQTNSSVPRVQNPMPDEKTNSNIHDDKTDNTAVVEPAARQEQPKENAQGKKKLGEVLKGIFSKKEKKQEAKSDEPVLEDPRPANNRQATRRDDANGSEKDPESGEEISTAALMQQVDLSSNAPENWMMGVKNLKISLKNRSNVTLQAASVTVNYYDENDQLLEKKLIYFSNVAPKAKATVAAPDHKFADHVDFKLTTVTAKEDRFARY